MGGVGSLWMMECLLQAGVVLVAGQTIASSRELTLNGEYHKRHARHGRMSHVFANCPCGGCAREHGSQPLPPRRNIQPEGDLFSV